MIKLRRMHLYLGCFFAPLLLFFVCTGWYQTLHPDRRKGPGEAEATWDRLRAVHADSLLPSATASGYATKPFRWFVVATALGFIITVVLGIILAFRFSKQKWAVWLSLILGVVLPLALLMLGQKH
jgi:VIT1/CCC1 family predicted Fe2+/Mn2+ transporter